MAKRYRKYAKATGLLKTLSEKNTNRRGNISKLVGAVDVWYWGDEQGNLADEMLNLGMEKVLFANTDVWNIDKINKLGFLTSKIENYQDVWPPIWNKITHRIQGWPD